MYKPLDLQVVNDSELAKKLNKPSSPSHGKSAVCFRRFNSKDSAAAAADTDDDDFDDEMDSGDDHIDADDVTEF